MVAAIYDKTEFFKYYTAEAAKLTLATCARKWSTPFAFNDPFDNQVDLFFEEPTAEVVAREVERINDILSSPDPLPPEQFGSLAVKANLIREIRLANPGFRFVDNDIAELREAMLEGMQATTDALRKSNADIRELLSDTSLFCVTETHTNLLMWSHYAHNHTGAVVKFLPVADSPLLLAKGVRYSDRLPRIAFSLLWNASVGKTALLEAATLSKGKVWDYEQEWRVVTTLRDKSKLFEILPFDPKEVDAVYLGCKITEQDRREIVAITQWKYPGKKIFQAVRHESEYALNFVEEI